MGTAAYAAGDAVAVDYKRGPATPMEIAPS
jgi:hypothetical protein